MFKKENIILYLFVFIHFLKMTQAHENPNHIVFISCVLLILAHIVNIFIKKDTSDISNSSTDES